MRHKCRVDMLAASSDRMQIEVGRNYGSLPADGINAAFEITELSARLAGSSRH